MLKLNGSKRGEKGFTLIELLVVAAIIGILLAIAIPNLLKARISANEAGARKMMQTLRDAEAEYFEQDLNDAGGRDFTNLIGANGTPDSLRQPGAAFLDEDALIDSSFEGALAGGATADCDTAGGLDPKAGYCITPDFTDSNGPLAANAAGGFDDFGWEASMTSAQKVGRRDFSVYGDGSIRCVVSAVASGMIGTFSASRMSGGCD